MAFRQSRQILAGYPTLNARAASEAVTATADYLVPAGGLPAGEIIEMLGIPEGCVATEVQLVSEDLDSNGTPTVTLDVGVLSGPYGALTNTDGSARTIGNEFIAASTVGQAGGSVLATKAAGFNLTPSLDVTPIGIKAVGAVATAIVGARIRLNVTYHAMPVGV